MKPKNLLTKNTGKFLTIVVWVLILTISIIQGLADPGGIPLPPW